MWARLPEEHIYLPWEIKLPNQADHWSYRLLASFCYLYKSHLVENAPNFSRDQRAVHSFLQSNGIMDMNWSQLSNSLSIFSKEISFTAIGEMKALFINWLESNVDVFELICIRVFYLILTLQKISVISNGHRSHCFLHFTFSLSFKGMNTQNKKNKIACWA